MLDLAIETAYQAGKYLLLHLGKIHHLEYKKEQVTNLVTEFDKGAEEIIIKKIQKQFPSHDIMGEECGNSYHQNSDYCWIIDPLDGTTNYAHGLPVFSVSIGLEYKGEIIIGVIYNPSMDEMFYAEKGKGAFLNGRKIHISSTEKLISSLLVTGFPYNIKENPGNVIEYFINFLPQSRGVRRLGSAAIDLAYIAAGRFDGYWEVFLNPWDKAAGILLVQEAGGKVTDFLGNTATPYQQQTLATNGIIHQQMLDVICSI